MKEFRYQLDQPVPLWEAIIYGIQWAVMFFPGLLIVTDISSTALGLSFSSKAHYFQYLLLVSGFVTVVQTLWGHRYPIQEGPSTAVLLAYVGLAPYGIHTIQGGLIASGALVFILGLSGQVKRLNRYFTPNVTGVILLLIAFCLLPFLMSRLLGITPEHPNGQGVVAAVAFALILLIALLTHWLSGYLQTTAIILGVLVGYVIFVLWGKVRWNQFVDTPWLQLPKVDWAGKPSLFWPSMISMTFAYLAVVINSIGSIQGTATVVGEREIEKSLNKGIAFNGLGGIISGFLGVVGTVSYSSSPGVVLATRVASRYALTACGVLLIVTGLIPKLSALFASVPAAVVGAALCVAIGFQIGAGIDTISGGDELSVRDYLVVGLPVVIGTIVSVVPREFFAPLPAFVSVVFSNGLVLGIILVLLLEHVLLKKKGGEIS